MRSQSVRIKKSVFASRSPDFLYFLSPDSESQIKKSCA
jgi:hypothetical protein